MITRLPPRLPRPALVNTGVRKPLADILDASRPYPRIRLELAPGADPTANPATWNWVNAATPYHARQEEGVTIRRGRSDTALQPTPATMSFTLNNGDGRYTPDLPTSPYYPYMREGLPVRLWVNYGSGDTLRGTFFVDTLSPRWSTDLTYSYVDIQASGLLHRLSQGTRPTRSLLTTWNLADTQPIAHWGLEDTSGSDSFHESIGNNPPMLWNETEPTFGTAGPPAATGVVRLAALTELAAAVSPYTTASSVFTVIWIVYIPSAPSSTTPIINVNTNGTVTEWRLCITPSGGTDTVTIQGYDANGALTVNSSTNFVIGSLTEPYGYWLSCRLYVAQSGSDISWAWKVTEMTTESSVSNSGTASTQTWGTVYRVGVHNGIAPHADWMYGHIALYDYSIEYPSDILDGYTGETTVERMQEALSYENEPALTVVGSGSDTQLLGPWPAGTVTNTLFNAEKADGGVLYDALTPNLEYRTRTSKYNQSAALTLDISAGEVQPPFGGDRDDSRLRNEWAISRTGGSTATYKDTVSQAAVGRYADSDTVNVDTDDILYHHAGWRTNLSTSTKMRHLKLKFQLHRDPELAAAWCATDIGDRVSLINPPSTYPPGTVDLILEGYTEKITGFLWYVEANTTPYLPWDVYTVADSARGVVPTGGTVLGAGITTTGTTLSLVSADVRNLWTTTATFPADFPLSIEVGGEQMTVSGIVGTSSPQTATVSARSVNGVVKAHSPGTPVQVWRPAPLAL